MLQISDKDMSLLEERIKRAAKNRPVASVKPLQQTMAPRPSVAPAPAPVPVYDEPESEEDEEPLPVIPQIQRYNIRHCFSACKFCFVVAVL